MYAVPILSTLRLVELIVKVPVSVLHRSNVPFKSNLYIISLGVGLPRLLRVSMTVPRLSSIVVDTVLVYMYVLSILSVIQLLTVPVNVLMKFITEPVHFKKNTGLLAELI